MSRYVADTNPLIYYLNRVAGESYRRHFEKIVCGGVVISVITRLEVLSWTGYTDNPTAVTDAEALLSTIDIFKNRFSSMLQTNPWRAKTLARSMA